MRNETRCLILASLMVAACAGQPSVEDGGDEISVGFEEEMLFYPADRILPQGDRGDDRYVFDARYSWRRVFGQQARRFDLKVCAFQNGGVSTVAGNSFQPVALSDNQLNEYMVRISELLRPWEEAEATTAAGRQLTSGIRFHFWGQDGKPFRCEDDGRDAHVRILINDSESKGFSTYGSNSWNPSSNRGTATMTLPIHLNKSFTPYVVLHEFGHALGLRHEMDHEMLAQCANRFLSEEFIKDRGPIYPNVGSDLASQAAEAKKRIFAAVRTQYKSNLSDKNSIMGYKLPTKYFTAGASDCVFATEPNKLSSKDIEFVVTYYRG